MNLKGRLLRLEAARSARVNEIWPKILPFLVNAARPGASADIRARAYQISKIVRNIAHRAGMDYLTQVPETIGRAIPDSLASCSERADRVTSVLDEILHQKTVPAPPRLFS